MGSYGRQPLKGARALAGYERYREGAVGILYDWLLRYINNLQQTELLLFVLFAQLLLV